MKTPRDGCGSTQCCLAPHYELLKCFPQQKYLSGANMILFQVCAGLSDKKVIRNIMRHVFYSLLHCCCLRSVGVTNGNSGHPAYGSPPTTWLDYTTKRAKVKTAKAAPNVSKVQITDMLLLTTSFLGYPLPRSHRHGDLKKKMFPSTSYSFLL